VYQFTSYSRVCHEGLREDLEQLKGLYVAKDRSSCLRIEGSWRTRSSGALGCDGHLQWR
jgi:hypothetical protein